MCLVDELHSVNPLPPVYRREFLDEWCNIPQDQIDNLILSMSRRRYNHHKITPVSPRNSERAKRILTYDTVFPKGIRALESTSWSTSTPHQREDFES
ncbi:hypothetical protein TNCV_1161871 [Trichonephila clavipes]|nr:hypothetical protein TNCV_1161871 [Trichonephila clavipes]